MKFNKITLLSSILLLSIIFLTGCTPGSPTSVPVTGITILQDDFLQIVLGGTPFQLTIEVEPVLATNKAVTWTSSNPDVATVDGNGLVTAVAGGIVIITVTTVDGGFTDSVEIEAAAIY